METVNWIVRYVAYSGDIVWTSVEASADASESEVIDKAYDAEFGYSNNYISTVIDVSRE